jgi:BASS family bile acid:Na+ symporter
MRTFARNFGNLSPLTTHLSLLKVEYAKLKKYKEMNTIFIVLPILTLLMFDLGLALKPDDFRLFVHRPHALLAGLIGQIVLLPLIAWAIGTVFHIQPLFFLGIMLIACSPGGSSSNVFSMLAGGDVALSVSLTAFSSVINLLTGPAVMDWATQAVGTAADIHLPVGNLLVQNLVLMAVPILIGLFISVKWASTAQRLHSVLKRLAFPCLILLATVFFVQHRETIVREFPALGLCVTVLILLSMGSGVLMSWLMRLSGREQRTIVIEIGMQNAAQAITVASSPFVFNNEVMAIPAIIYALMMNVILLTYVGIVKRIRL